MPRGSRELKLAFSVIFSIWSSNVYCWVAKIPTEMSALTVVGEPSDTKWEQLFVEELATLKES